MIVAIVIVMMIVIAIVIIMIVAILIVIVKVLRAKACRFVRLARSGKHAITARGFLKSWTDIWQP